MKLTTFILFVFTLHISANGFSQNITLSVENAPVQKVLNLISRQTGFSMVYDESSFNESGFISIEVKDAPLEKVLDLCFGENQYSYHVENNMIFIQKGIESKVVDQPIKVTGTVTDKEGRPLPSASIMIKGTQTGVITNSNGSFTINAEQGDVLIFTFVGYMKQEVVVSIEKTEVNVVMEEELSELEEVMVISTGYQEIEQERSTGSIASIKSKEYDSRVNTVDFLTGLENKIPGLLINSDIEFEGNSLFQIRGISTINGNANPLIVVDGFPTELSMDMINPNEIESVTVLKDAAAATVYGVRASNGVIVIERKKAKVGKVRVDFRATTSFKPKENYERYRWDDDVTNTYINYQRDSYNSGSYLWNNITNPYSGAYFDVSLLTTILAQEAAGVITADEANQQYQELGSYNNLKDYSRLFLQTASTQTYNLDISGGDKNVLYYLTANYAESDLNKIKNGNNSFKLSGRSTIKILERLSLDLTTDFRLSNTNAVPIPGLSSIYPYERFEDEDGNPLAVSIGSYANIYYNEYLISKGLMDNLYYPLQEVNEVSDKTNVTSNRITANFKYDIGKGLNLTFGGVYETSRSDNKYLASENSSVVRQLINRYSSNGAGGVVFNIPVGAYLQQTTSSRESFTIRGQLNYNKNINEDHAVNLILGGEVRDVVDKSGTSPYFAYNDQTLLHLPIDYATLTSSLFPPTYAGRNPTLVYDNLFNKGYSDNRFVSLYSNVVYAYKGKYSLTGSMRIDQSNLFGTDPKYHYKPLWSVGAAWNMHKEEFMQGAKWLTSLKLRGAYGFNGNVAKNSLPQVIAIADYNLFDPTNYTHMLSLYSYANSGLRWEQTENFNIGADYSIFERITGNFDYYIKKSTDLLATNQIDASKGGTSALINQASIRNNGFEASLHADWITRKKFNWNTGFIFSHNTSKVLSVYNELTDQSLSSSYVSGSYTNFMEGYSIGAMFNYRYAGLNEQGVPLIYDKNGNTKTFFTDDGGIEEVDYVGSSIPVMNFGLSNRVDIGNFYFYSMINFYGGFKTRVPVPFVGDMRPLEGADNYWKEAGDEANPDVLPTPKTSNYTNLGYTDKYTVNGAYLTLGDLTASYSLRDNELVQKVGISNLEVRMQASNLFTVGFNKFNYSSATGSYAKSYLTPTYSLGVYVSF